MRAVVLFDSEYGNTRKIAEAIAEVLEKRYDVELLPAADAERITRRPDLLLVGSPTHHRRPTKRILAAIRSLPADVLNRVSAAAFCTRYDRPRFLTGAASLGIARALSRRGARIEIAAESFQVSYRGGELVPGERSRARRWAFQLSHLTHPNPLDH